VEEFVEAIHARMLILMCVSVAIAMSLTVVWQVYYPKSRQADQYYDALAVGQTLLMDWRVSDGIGNSSLVLDKSRVTAGSENSVLLGHTWQAKIETSGFQYTAGYQGLVPKKSGNVVLPAIVRLEDRTEAGKVRVWVW